MLIANRSHDLRMSASSVCVYCVLILKCFCSSSLSAALSPDASEGSQKPILNFTGQTEIEFLTDHFTFTTCPRLSNSQTLQYPVLQQ